MANYDLNAQISVALSELEQSFVNDVQKLKTCKANIIARHGEIQNLATTYSELITAIDTSGVSDFIARKDNIVSDRSTILTDLADLITELNSITILD